MVTLAKFVQGLEIPAQRDSWTPSKDFPLTCFILVVLLVFLVFNLGLFQNLLESEAIMMAKIIQVDGLTNHDIDVLNDEAARNKVSRNSLLLLVIETFVKNVELSNATDILNEPLQDVTKQLNKLTEAVTNSNRGVARDMQNLVTVIEQQTQQLNTIIFNEDDQL